MNAKKIKYTVKKQVKLLLIALLSVFGSTVYAADAVQSVQFQETSAPRGEAEMTQVHSNGHVAITRLDGSQYSLPLAYHVLYRSGEYVAGWSAGQIVTSLGKPLMISSYDEYAHKGQGPVYATGPDSNSRIELTARAGKQSDLFLVTHFEYDTDAPAVGGDKTWVNLYGKLPMAINVATLVRDKATGELKATRLKNVDMKAVDGLWIPCAGEKTPWNTHLGSEEYEPDARTFERTPLEAMNLYLGTPGKVARNGGANPYAYGFITEVKVKADGSGHIAKHYSMGRFSHELGTVMPDQRTVYLSDDGRDVMMGMYVADRPRELSAGTLYAAKWQQNDAGNGGKAHLQWIRLGHATDKQVRAMIHRKVHFSDIFDHVTDAAYHDNPAQYVGYHPVYVYTGTGGVTQLEYLKLKPGMEQVAAFLETRRYAAYLGATTEFSKMEGMTSNSYDRKLYFAISYAEGGMLAGNNDSRPQDDISLDDPNGNLACGAVYQSDLVRQSKDTMGKPIASQWVAGNTSALITGARKPAEQTAYGQYDKCDTDKVSNPDNIKYSPQLHTLFVGEDSNNHLNNFLWAYDVRSQKLTRLAAAPIGAEWTGLAPGVTADGFAYIMANVQHPGAEDDLSQYQDVIKMEMASKVDKRGIVGYLPLGQLSR
jgi:hypothetical protein